MLTARKRWGGTAKSCSFATHTIDGKKQIYYFKTLARGNIQEIQQNIEVPYTPWHVRAQYLFTRTELWCDDEFGNGVLRSGGITKMWAECN